MTARTLPLNGRATGPKQRPYVVPDFKGLWTPEIIDLPCGIGVAEAFITPELAEVIRGLNRPDNRKQRATVKLKYVEDMRNDDWALTHQGIAFDPDGYNNDGQHRIVSCIEAKAGFPTLVFFGVRDMEYMDLGASRTVSDASRYCRDTPLTTKHTALIRSFLYGTTRSRYALTHANILAAADRFHKGLDFVYHRYHAHTVGRPPACVAAAIMRAYYHVEPKDLARFFDLLLEKIDPSQPRDKTVKSFRRHLATVSKHASHHNQRDLYCKSQRAVQAYINGESLERLLGSDADIFPMPDEQQVAERESHDPIEPK